MTYYDNTGIKVDTMKYKTQHRKLKSEQHEPNYNRSGLRCSGKVNSSCSTSDTRHITIVTYPVIIHEWGKDRIAITANRTHIP
jgi:hypothetical protein